MLVVNNTDTGAKFPQFKFWINYLLSVRPWKNYLIYLCFNYPSIKQWENNSTNTTRLMEELRKWIYVKPIK